MNQLELHKKIDEFFKAGVDSADVGSAKKLLINNDAKRYFFSQADEHWITWLWKEEFLEEIEKKSEDSTQCQYRLPELDYLTRVAERKPARVAEIILDKNTATKKDNFNPEVIDRFLWIISNLLAEQIKTLTKKIKDEKWVYLMRNFNKTGYEFKKTIKKLVDARENEAILELAQVIFIIKSKKEIAEKSRTFSVDDPFYLHNMQDSGVYDALANIGESYVEKALRITIDIMSKIVKLAEKDESGVFDYSDQFSLYDVDFFTLEIQNRHMSSQSEDIKNLAAVIKKLIERVINVRCNNVDEGKRFVAEYLDKLPMSRSTWRLKLFVLAQCPEVFKGELQKALFRLFEEKKYYEIEGGTEYKKALKIAFPYLSNSDQRDYVAKVLRYFSEKDKQDPDQGWHKRIGWEILSCICDNLKDDELKKCEEIFDRKCDKKYTPKPEIGQVTSGIIHHKSPISLDNYSINQIIEKLKDDLTPEQLKEKYARDDFLNPRGVEGLGDALKENLKIRTAEYTKLAKGFFDRKQIHPHYTYSFLRAVEEMLREGNFSENINWDELFNLFKKIKNSGEKEAFKIKEDDSWLTGWIAVHDAIAEILLQSIGRGDDKLPFVFKRYRDDIFDLVKYLFTVNDPIKEHEKSEYGDLMSIAINSVKGRAFQVFTRFVYHDGKEFKKEDKIKIKHEIKKFYEKIIEEEESLAVRFLFGHYLASFYYRDKEWIRDRFPKIFLMDGDQFASWEGYLNSSVYKEIFEDLQDYYSKAISINESDHPKERKLAKPLDEILSVHLALAYIYFEDFDFKHPLFIKFWEKESPERQKEFFSFIGRHCLSCGDAGDKWFEENKVDKKKILKFWDWLLENRNITDPKIFSGFGFWINPDKEILDDKILVKKIARTIEKSDGDINWDYGLMQRLIKFAEIDPKNTISIIENYLLDKDKNPNQHRGVPMFHADEEIKEALNIIYQENKELKQDVEKLIDLLIEKGSQIFWGLKDVIEKDSDGN